MENKPIIGNRSMLSRRLHLGFYDAILLLIVDFLILVIKPSSATSLSLPVLLWHVALSALCIFLCRSIWNVYKQVWRYGTPMAYMRLIFSDMIAGMVYYVLQAAIPITGIEFIRAITLFTMNLLFAISIRIIYHLLYDQSNRRSKQTGLAWKAFYWLSGLVASNDTNKHIPRNKIKIAIVGAGRVGSMLAEELLNNPCSLYTPCCFIDIDRLKIGRQISGILVLSDDEATAETLRNLEVQELVFALPQISAERKMELYEYYKKTGCRIRVYDYPVMQKAENGKRHMRDFDIEELLCRNTVELPGEEICSYYKDKVVLITGGGGSIGSELCRQIAAMNPQCLIILDICENGAYEIQQELMMNYGNVLDVKVEIVSICDRGALDKVIAMHKPNIILHAAAHKHVPLMERNCAEAVKNNVFGTLNVVELAEKHEVGRFIMISTDKAVNPTNVMGATKRMCEMLVQAHSRSGSKTVFSATRFGNVLGSAGSVIPLFKKQIMRGGPITLTDKRIIRFFMTIPEASQLVLHSGVLAKNGELFVLDMGKPVRILDLAENMIRLSGFEPHKDIEIVETGLRPGEKLYEELLIKTEELDKTENSKIFIERDEPLSLAEIDEKLAILRQAVEAEDDGKAKEALKKTVPTFYDPNEINPTSHKAPEMIRATK